MAVISSKMPDTLVRLKLPHTARDFALQLLRRTIGCTKVKPAKSVVL